MLHLCRAAGPEVWSGLDIHRAPCILSWIILSCAAEDKKKIFHDNPLKVFTKVKALV